MFWDWFIAALAIGVMAQVCYKYGYDRGWEARRQRDIAWRRPGKWD